MPGADGEKCLKVTPNSTAPGEVRAYVQNLSGSAAWDTTGQAGESTSCRGRWTFDTRGASQTQIDAMQGARVSVDLVRELQSDDAPAT